MSDPNAYLLTWTCYGMWLHGDERGSVTKDENAFGAPFHAPNTQWSLLETGRLSGRAAALDDSAREIVLDAIIEHCRHRQWRLLAVHIRTNHVHVVVAYERNRTPESMLISLKARATRCLRNARCFAGDAPVWTRHGSTRYLWNERDVIAAVEYVMNGQGPDTRFASLGDDFR